MSARAAWRRLGAITAMTAAAVVTTSVIGITSADASTTQQSHLPPVSFRINHAANVAISHIGDPYRYGAAGPSSFDCSGLAMFSYGHARLSLPRTSAGQYA